VAGQIIPAIAAGLICGVVLNVLYLCLKHVWPENYFGLSGSVDPIVSRNLLRWALFRLVPPMLGAAAASLTAERSDAWPWLAAGITAMVHLTRVGLAVRSAVDNRRWAAAVGNGAIALLLLSVMTGATFGRHLLAPIIPEPEDLVSNIWAGFLAALGAVYIQQIVLLRKEPASLLSKSMNEIPMPLKAYAYARATEAGLDPRLPLSIMIIENLQRPSWARAVSPRRSAPGTIAMPST
jgi:hypothetical protein